MSCTSAPTSTESSPIGLPSASKMLTVVVPNVRPTTKIDLVVIN